MPDCFQTSHMPRDPGVYRIVNTVTNESYIGGSIDLSRRTLHHLSTLRAGRSRATRLQRSFDAHGETAFIIECIELCRPEDVLRRERHWVETQNPELNTHAVGSREEKLSESVRVLLPDGFLPRLMSIARRLGVPPTRLARSYIEAGVSRDEQQARPEPSVA